MISKIIALFYACTCSITTAWAADFGFGTLAFRDTVVAQADKFGLRANLSRIQHCEASQGSEFGARYCDIIIFAMRTRLWYDGDEDKISLITMYPTRYNSISTMPLAVSLLIVALEPAISDREAQQMAARLVSVGSTLSGKVEEAGVVADYSCEVTRRGYLFKAFPKQPISGRR